jgi:hypothetical protein
MVPSASAGLGVAAGAARDAAIGVAGLTGASEAAVPSVIASLIILSLSIFLFFSFVYIKRP